METKTQNSKIKTAVNVVLWVFMVLAIIATIIAFLSNASGRGFPVIGDKCLFCVQSDSMDGPEGFKAGDLIIGRYLNTAEEKNALQKRDVITFYVDLDGDGQKELNTHRIVDFRSDGAGFMEYQTQGDKPGAPVDEAWVKSLDVQAVWTGTKIPVLGSIIGFLQSPTGFLICVIIPITAIFVYQLVLLVKTVSSLKNKGKRTITQEEEDMIKQRAVEEYLAKQLAKDSKVETQEAVSSDVAPETEAQPKENSQEETK